MGLKKMVSDVDGDGNGTIEFGEFLDDDRQDGREGLPRGHREGLQAVRRRQHQQDLLPQPRPVAEELGENIDDEELQDMINQADRDGDGEINLDEFYRIM